jgi:hypothetical protein
MRLFAAKLFYGVRNLLIDLKYGAPLMGMKRTEVEGQASIVNGDYSLYPLAFKALTVKPDDVIVDIGSGRGRFLNWTLHHGFRNRVIGVEYDGETAAEAERRLAKYPNVAVVHADATKQVPEEGTIFFVFNPFEEELMTKFKDKMKSTFRDKHDFTILYLRPLELDVFKKDPDWQVREGEIPKDQLDVRYEGRDTYRQYAVIRLRH